MTLMSIGLEPDLLWRHTAKEIAESMPPINVMLYCLTDIPLTLCSVILCMPPLFFVNANSASYRGLGQAWTGNHTGALQVMTFFCLEQYPCWLLLASLYRKVCNYPRRRNDCSKKWWWTSLGNVCGTVQMPWVEVRMVATCITPKNSISKYLSLKCSQHLCQTYSRRIRGKSEPWK